MLWVKGNVLERNRFVHIVIRNLSNNPRVGLSLLFFFFRTCFSSICLCVCILSLHRNTCPNIFWALTCTIFFIVFSLLPWFSPCSTIHYIFLLFSLSLSLSLTLCVIALLHRTWSWQSSSLSCIHIAKISLTTQWKRARSINRALTKIIHSKLFML